MQTEILPIGIVSLVGTAMQGAVDASSAEFFITNALQILAVLGGITGLIWGWREKKQAARQGSQTIEKNSFDFLVEQNQMHLETIRKQRKTVDKFWALRELALKTEEGRKLVKEAEEIADQVSSDEP